MKNPWVHTNAANSNPGPMIYNYHLETVSDLRLDNIKLICWRIGPTIYSGTAQYIYPFTY